MSIRSTTWCCSSFATIVRPSGATNASSAENRCPGGRLLDPGNVQTILPASFTIRSRPLPRSEMSRPPGKRVLGAEPLEAEPFGADGTGTPGEADPEIAEPSGADAVAPALDGLVPHSEAVCAAASPAAGAAGAAECNGANANATRPTAIATMPTPIARGPAETRFGLVPSWRRPGVTSRRALAQVRRRAEGLLADDRSRIGGASSRGILREHATPRDRRADQGDAAGSSERDRNG
jgi:hypothetical protein